MSEVVEFKRPDSDKCEECAEPLVWVCLCGCTTWYARTDDVLQCAACDNISTDGPAGWRVSLPDDQGGTVEDTFKFVGGEGSEFWLKRHAKPGIRAAIIIDANGKPVTWRDGDITDAERQTLSTALGRI